MIVPGAIYQNIKKGDMYSVIAVAKDCTNARIGEFTVFYVGGPTHSELFSRESKEFEEKFYYVAE